MSAAEIARLNREMRTDGFPGDLVQSTALAKGLLQEGFVQHSDVEGMEVQDTAAWELMDRVQKVWFRDWVEKAAHRNKKRRMQESESILVADGSKASADSVVSMLRHISGTPFEHATETPMARIKMLMAEHQTQEVKDQWVAKSRTNAICGGCQMSTISSTISAIKCWAAFATGVLGCRPGQELPPSVDGLAAWSRIFRCKRTFSEYASKVKTACLVAHVSTDA